MSAAGADWSGTRDGIRPRNGRPPLRGSREVGRAGRGAYSLLAEWLTKCLRPHIQRSSPARRRAGRTLNGRPSWASETGRTSSPAAPERDRRAVDRVKEMAAELGAPPRRSRPCAPGGLSSSARGAREFVTLALLNAARPALVGSLMQMQERSSTISYSPRADPAELRRRAKRHRAMARLIGDEQVSQALGAVAARDETDAAEAERQAGEWTAAQGGH